MKRKDISPEKYNQKMQKVIVKYQDKSVDECLIALLEEASKWNLKSSA